MRIRGLWRLRKPWNWVKRLPERGVDALASRGVLPPYGAPAHHPVLAAFAPLPVAADGVDTDYLGLRTQAEMLPPYWRSPPPAGVPAAPDFDEEYFEWLDVLEAADEAARAGAADFTMIEVGAGYARWAARGWAAARRRGLSAHIGVVEAEPQHIAWAKSHMAFNGIPDADITFFESAVGAEAGETVFLVEMPEGSEGNSPREWYGQAVAWDDPASGAATARTYFGHPLVAMPGGWHGVTVQVARLSGMLARFGRIDLVDFDIQGMELEVIREALGPLSAQVRRLHIGTHSREIDAELPRLLGGAGWRCVRAYPCLRWNRTEFGWIRFNDGVQTWVNPTLAPA
jgi:FkbM family methyltransferase